MFTTSKQALASALQMVQSASVAHDPSPILSSLLFEGDETGLWITASNHEVTVMAAVPGDYEPFSFLISAAPLLHLIPLFGGEFSMQEESGRILVKHGRARHKIPCFDTAAFPETPAVQGAPLLIKGGLFKQMVDATLFAVDSNPDGKYPAMQGLHFAVANGELTLVGCNGVRMAVASTLMEGEADLVIPSKAASIFAKFAEAPGMVEIIPMESHVAMRSERGLVISRLRVGQFPDWRLVMPKDVIHVAELDASDFLLAIRRVGFAANQRDSADAPAITMKCTLSSTEMLLETQSADKGEGKEVVDIKCPTLTNVKVVGLAGRQILDFVSEVENGIIKLQFSADMTAPLLFSPKRDFGFVYNYVSMPTRLKF